MAGDLSVCAVTSAPRKGASDCSDPILCSPDAARTGEQVKALTDREIEELASRTLAHYDREAQAFEGGTRTHDVTQNYQALLGAIQGPPPFTLLDLGCGPGRDLAAFRAMGHEAVGLDGSGRFVEMARAATGCEVLHQNFLALSLPRARFHGVFANASLFHVPTQELDR